MSKHCVAEIESNCGVSEPFQLRSEEHVKGATPVLVLPSRSERKLFPPSRRERTCVRGLIGKPCRQTDSRHLVGDSSLQLSKKKGTGTMAGPQFARLAFGNNRWRQADQRVTAMRRRCFRSIGYTCGPGGRLPWPCIGHLPRSYRGRSQTGPA